jgi:hypothetical protein
MKNFLIYIAQILFIIIWIWLIKYNSETIDFILNIIWSLLIFTWVSNYKPSKKIKCDSHNKEIKFRSYWKEREEFLYSDEWRWFRFIMSPMWGNYIEKLSWEEIENTGDWEQFIWLDENWDEIYK